MKGQKQQYILFVNNSTIDNPTSSWNTKRIQMGGGDSISPTSQTIIPTPVRAYLEQLLNEADMHEVDEKMHEDMLMEVYDRLNRYIATTILEHLPSEHQEAFAKMNEENKPQEEIQQFLTAHIQNSQEVFARCFQEFRDLYLGNVAQARKSQEERGELAQQNTVPVKE